MNTPAFVAARFDQPELFRQSLFRVNPGLAKEAL
jgi:hypothetical protein